MSRILSVVFIFLMLDTISTISINQQTLLKKYNLPAESTILVEISKHIRHRLSRLKPTKKADKEDFF